MSDPKDEWDVEILPDGSVKITTGPHSAAIHTDATKLLSKIETTLGGKNRRAPRRDAHGHHEHNHKHDRHHHH